MKFRFLTLATEDGKSTDGADLVMQEEWSRVQFGDLKYQEHLRYLSRWIEQAVDCCICGLSWTQVFGKHQSLYGFIAMGKGEITKGACTEGRKMSQP